MVTGIRRIGIVLVLAASLPTLIAAQTRQALPLTETLPLQVVVLAADVHFPAGMAELPDGSIIVGSSNPVGGSYFQSTGEILRFAGDVDPTIVATDLPGAITSVARLDEFVFVTTVSRPSPQITILRKSGEWSEPLVEQGHVSFGFRGFSHETYGLAVRPGPNGSIELYFNVGASGNDTAGGAVQLGGLLDSLITVDAALYRSIVTDSGDSVTLSEPELIATGIRNTMGFGFHPETGDLWITDNGIDGLEDVWSSHSADELDVIRAAEIGGDPEDFGFPDTYTRYPGGELVGSTGIAPHVAFLPIDSMENEGAASLAFTPSSLQPLIGNLVFVGFHGQYDLHGLENEENALLAVDLDTAEVSVVVRSGQIGVGHLDSLLATEDALYIADLCADSSLGTAEPCGVLYKLVAIEQSTTET